MKRVICFLRVSSQRQDLTPQRDAVMDAILRDKYKESEILEVSGKESAIKKDEEERETLNEMKNLVNHYPSIESIYFFAVDRCARRMSIVLSVAEWADKNNINLVFLHPYPISTMMENEKGKRVKNPMSEMILFLMGYAAQMEMNVKTARFEAAKERNKELNKPNGKIIYGYTTDKDKNVIADKVKGQVVKWVFDSYLKDGMSTTEIFDEGVARGYWHDLSERTSKANHIRIMLKNYCYAGRPNNSGLVYPAIVEESDVDAAIKLMSTKMNKPKSYTRNQYLCKGFIRDAETGYKMVADNSHIKYKLRQQGVIRYGININVADTLIWRTAYECKWNMLTHADEGQQDAIKAQLEEINLKITNIYNHIDNVIQPKYQKSYTAYINGKGGITEQMYNTQIDLLNKEKKEYQNRLESLQRRERELVAVLNELEHKEKINVSIYTLKEISDEKQRIEIIKECITDMTVQKIGNRKYIIKVYSIMPTSPNIYLYNPLGGRNDLFWVIQKENELDILKDASKYKDLVNDQVLLPIEDEIETRFERWYKRIEVAE